MPQTTPSRMHMRTIGYISRRLLKRIAVITFLSDVMKVLLILLLAAASQTQAARLAASGSSLTYGGTKVYLSGANAAWNSYGYDFGNGGYDGSLENWMRDINSAGGNSFRVWVHVEGYSTPAFDGSGLVTSCDSAGQFIGDVQKLLDSAQSSNILVTLTLWNGAVLSNQNYKDLILDDNKLQSYLDNCLAPLAQAVAGHPALGSWESINEPEGSVQVASDANACYDTNLIGQSGAGWTGANIPMQRFLRFIGKMNQVIRANDPGGIISVGSWGHFPQSDAFSNTHNHYTDSCLNDAAGGSNAGVDFVQMHTYDWGSDWAPNAPFTVSASDYGTGKAIVIGEFSSDCSLGTPLSTLHEYAYTHGYSGTWTWHWTATGDCSDSQDTQRQGLSTLAGRTDNGVVDISVG